MDPLVNIEVFASFSQDTNATLYIERRMEIHGFDSKPANGLIYTALYYLSYIYLMEHILPSQGLVKLRQGMVIM